MGEREIFDRLIYTLNQIDVKGEENHDMLLGCIRVLKKMRDMVKVEATENREEECDNGNHERPRDDISN